jgi:hypothetical protein
MGWSVDHEDGFVRLAAAITPWVLVNRVTSQVRKVPGDRRGGDRVANEIFDRPVESADH